MKVEVTMPRLSDSMSEGSVTSWFKNEGDAVTKDEAIAELETEKSTVDLVAPESGVLARIVVAAGSGNVAVGTVLAEIETEAAVAAAKPAPSTAKATSTAASAAPAGASPAEERGGPPASDSAMEGAAEPGAAPAPAMKGVERKAPARIADAAAKRRDESATPEEESTIAATPLARRMAAQAGLSLASLGRSGIGGKVSKADVEAALGRSATLAAVPPRPAPAAASKVATRTVPARVPAGATVASPMSRVRRTIAERMSLAKATIPHFYLSVDCRVDRLLDVRKRLKDDDVAVSVNDFVVRAAAIALSRVPDANASWKDGEGIVRHERIDIAVAVALDDGLVTPVVRDVRSMGLGEIGATVKELASRARDGKLAPHEYDGATFTISNLGMYGVGEMFAIMWDPLESTCRHASLSIL